MIIRVADPLDDCLGLMDGAKNFIDRMDWNVYFPKDPEKLVEAMSIIFTAEQVEIAVAEEDGKIVAAIGMLYQPHFWNPDLIHAEEVFWWQSEDSPKSASLRLLKFVKNRAHDKGAKILTFTRLTSTPEKVEKVYHRMGLNPREIRYSGVI